MLHFDKLIPTLHNISRSEDVDLGVADNMLQQCILEGKVLYRGADGPGKFAPDYAALFDAARASDEDGPGMNAEFNAFIKKRQAHFKELCDLWRDGECQAMVDLMEADTGDYGIGAFPNTREEAEEANKKAWEEDAPEGV